jgi:methionyl-tRNA formyltransferase
MRIVFFGTPEFAIPSLQVLAASSHVIAGVVTRPDRPRGRGRRAIIPSPISETAASLGLKVFKPERTSESGFLPQIKALQPDALAVAAYGALLPDTVLRTAPHGGWNVHPSLLPRWRGPAPIHRAIWAGDRETGVTIIKMASRLDAGPIARQESVPIGPGATRGDLEESLARIGASLLVESLSRLEHGKLELVEQDESKATFAPIFSPQDRQIDWKRPAHELDRLIRALMPEAGAYFVYKDCRVKILRARAEKGTPMSASPSTTQTLATGTLLSRTTEGWRISCGEGFLETITVQPEGKEHMTMNDFVNGWHLGAGESLVSIKTARPA